MGTGPGQGGCSAPQDAGLGRVARICLRRQLQTVALVVAGPKWLELGVLPPLKALVAAEHRAKEMGKANDN